MGSRYLTALADWCRAAGLVVVEVEGWQVRGRSSGGFDGDRPWCVMWHHTASEANPWDDVDYMVNGSPDKPLANLLLARDGSVYVMAAGATNTNGKGYALQTSRGLVPNDSMNTHAISIEAANNGVGEPWTQQQIDAYFLLSLTLARNLGLTPSDAANHQSWAPDRKIDPATSAAVQGPWRPRAGTPSGTWHQGDVITELIERSGAPQPLPPPTPVEGDEVLVVALDANGTAWVGNGVKRFALTDPAVFDRYVLVWAGRFLNTSGHQVKGWPDVQTVDDLVIESLGQA